MLKNFLKEKGIEYEDIDVSADQEKAQYMIGKTGQMGVPQTEIGDTWIIGFNKQKIMDALGIKE